MSDDEMEELFSHEEDVPHERPVFRSVFPVVLIALYFAVCVVVLIGCLFIGLSKVAP